VTVRRQRGWRLALKRALDVTVATAGLVIAAPVLGAVALAVRARLGSPVLFRQRRPGLGCAPFEVLKFRTMSEAVNVHGRPLPDEERLDRFGRWLRSTSLDELPQLWNVLRGDLSLVGPRPLLVQYLPRYSAEQARRHEVLPGITGWSQVNGRNAISWEEKLALDVWYVDHWSLGLDLRILAMTAGRVIRRSGISRAGSATMPEFMGTREDGNGAVDP
jgi:lipopolysaccharide/colanic/teichoic acid biosynthesis glycosyltransferase